MRHAHHLPGLTPPERLVLGLYTDLADEKRDAEAWPSRDQVCAVTGLSPKQVQRALSQLVGRGFIAVTGKAAPGRTLAVRLVTAAWPPLPTAGGRSRPLGCARSCPACQAASRSPPPDRTVSRPT